MYQNKYKEIKHFEQLRQSVLSASLQFTSDELERKLQWFDLVCWQNRFLYGNLFAPCNLFVLFNYNKEDKKHAFDEKLLKNAQNLYISNVF